MGINYLGFNSNNAASKNMASPMDYETLKSLVPLAVPAVKVAIENWLSPCIAKIAKTKELLKNSKPEQIEKVFEEYLIRSYARLSFMNTIVFGNQQKRISDLYIPLTVRSTGSKEQKYRIEGWRADFVPAFKRVVITDTAGMGKSTILKWLFLSSLGVADGIPIFVELRALSAKKPILDKIYEDICPIDKPFDKDLLLHLIKEGRFIFFFDGFDEVAFEDRKVVTEDIQGFIAKAFENLFLLASRHESALGSFGDFKEFGIQPLSKPEAYDLLRKYDDSCEHADALIAELEASKYEQLKDLMVNPMLVSLLFKAYSYKPKVPFKKQIFYRQVFDALFDMHDSTKGGAFVRKKQCELDIDEFHLVMRDLGFTTAKIGKVEYEKDAICELIKKVRERNTTVLFQPTSLLGDLITTVPLFNREGEHFKWAHKSVQDYFASQFIAVDSKGNQGAILERIYEGGHSRRFENILDLFHDTDNKGFRRYLLARLLKDYVQHYETTYLTSFPGVSADLVEKRKQLSFGRDIALAFIDSSLMRTHLASRRTAEKIFGSEILRKFRIDSSVFFQFEDSAAALGFRCNPAFGLLPLLASKRYAYVAKAGLSPHFRKGHKLAAVTAMVSDNPDCLFNKPPYFEFVNDLLAHDGFLINIDQVRRTIKTIDEEVDESLNVDQLLDNL
jgi:hypothetical protein